MKLRGLYAITPEAGDVELKVRLALEGGIALLQYRSKARNPAQAAAIVRMARDYRVPVIINDDIGYIRKQPQRWGRSAARSIATFVGAPRGPMVR